VKLGIGTRGEKKTQRERALQAVAKQGRPDALKSADTPIPEKSGGRWGAAWRFREGIVLRGSAWCAGTGGQEKKLKRRQSGGVYTKGDRFHLNAVGVGDRNLKN